MEALLAATQLLLRQIALAIKPYGVVSAIANVHAVASLATSSTSMTKNADVARLQGAFARIAAPTQPMRESLLVQPHRLPPRLPPPVYRGACTRCHVDYPLIADFFPKGDLKLNAIDRRTCYSCRHKEIIADATAQLPDTLADLVQSEGDDDPEIFCIDESDEDPWETQRPSITKFENLDPKQKAEARLAKRMTGCLITKIASPFSFAERRMRPIYLRARAQVKQEQEEKECLRLLMVEAAMPEEIFASVHTVAYDYSKDTYVPHEPDLDQLMEGPSLQAISCNLPILPAQEIDTKDRPDGSKSDSDSDHDDDDDNELELALTRLTLAHVPERERLNQFERRHALQYVEIRDVSVSQKFSANVQRAVKEEPEALTRLLERRLDCNDPASDHFSVPVAYNPYTYSQHLLLETAARTIPQLTDQSERTPVVDPIALVPNLQPFKRVKIEREASDPPLRSLSPQTPP